MCIATDLSLPRVTGADARASERGCPAHLRRPNSDYKSFPKSCKSSVEHCVAIHVGQCLRLFDVVRFTSERGRERLRVSVDKCKLTSLQAGRLTLGVRVPAPSTCQR